MDTKLSHLFSIISHIIAMGEVGKSNTGLSMPCGIMNLPSMKQTKKENI